MSLGEDEDEFLLIASGLEPFPKDALTEIRQERILGIGEVIELPPCKVEILLGTDGRLYVVLPTGVETNLPFACNAPFIQDPARLKIKDPELSPTNQWLLGRMGELAAHTMLRWLGNTELPIEERALAYQLLPNVDREDNSLEGLCAAHVECAVAEILEGKNLLLCESARLVPKNKSIIFPPEILSVWPAEQASAALDEENRPALCRHVCSDDQEKLVDWGLISLRGKNHLLKALLENHLPKPRTWRQLLELWHYLADAVLYSHYGWEPDDLRIVPVQGDDVLYAAREIVRLGEKRLLKSDEDWNFLSRYLSVLNQNYLRYLGEYRRGLNAESPASERNAVERAYALLDKLGIDKPSDVSAVVERVADAFFTGTRVLLAESVRLAQIAAKLGAQTRASFQMVTEDNVRRSVHNLCFDEDGTLAELLPESQRAKCLLHSRYSAEYKSCSKEEWREWVKSGRAGVRAFVSPSRTVERWWGRSALEEWCRERGLEGNLNYHFVTNEFIVEDWDFEEIYWNHWRALENSDKFVWVKVVDRLISRGGSFWKSAQSARVFHVATTGSCKAMTAEPLLPSWISLLQDLPCLPDTKGFPRKPIELLRHTRETEALLDVEPFVDRRLDTEAARPLLDLLGVRSVPTGPDGILERLRALSRASNPPIREVEKWYERLDQLIGSCSTQDVQRIKDGFRDESLILAHDGSWATAGAIFIAADEDDVPGSAVIRKEVNDLSLWRRIDVAQRPTADLAIQWLGRLSVGRVPEVDLPRVRALQARHPRRVWEECGHWLNLACEWISTDELRFTAGTHSDVCWKHLDSWVKRSTADIQRLPLEVVQSAPFSNLPALATQIEDRFHRGPRQEGRSPVRKEWLEAVGSALRGVKLDNPEETIRVRTLATRLAKTRWLDVPGLETIPYLHGRPAGLPRRTDVVWIGEVLFVDQILIAKLARRVPAVIGKTFDHPEIEAALIYSFDRGCAEIDRYVAANFLMEQPEQKLKVSDDDEDAEQASSELSFGDMSEQGAPETPSGSAEGSEFPIEEGTQNGNPSAGKFNGREHRIASRSAAPCIMERFALARGFRIDGESRFFHKDGSWIARVGGNVFPWERRKRSGDLVARYWPKDKCLYREPLQIEAEVLELIDQAPETHSLVLADADGKPVEITGLQVRRMLDERRMTIFPASYRIVYDAYNQV